MPSHRGCLPTDAIFNRLSVVHQLHSFVSSEASGCILPAHGERRIIHPLFLPQNPAQCQVHAVRAAVRSVNRSDVDARIKRHGVDQELRSRLWNSNFLLATMIMILSNLLCQIQTASFKRTLGFIILNLIAMIISIIFNQRVGDESFLEIMWYIAMIIGAFVNTVIHAIISKQNSAATVKQGVTIFEFEQYKDMFNSLQEGVIVLDQPTAVEPSYRVFFINEIMQTILKMLLPGDQSVGLQDHFVLCILNNFCLIFV